MLSPLNRTAENSSSLRHRYRSYLKETASNRDPHDMRRRRRHVQVFYAPTSPKVIRKSDFLEFLMESRSTIDFTFVMRCSKTNESELSEAGRRCQLQAAADIEWTDLSTSAFGVSSNVRRTPNRWGLRRRSESASVELLPTHPVVQPAKRGRLDRSRTVFRKFREGQMRLPTSAPTVELPRGSRTHPRAARHGDYGCGSVRWPTVGASTRRSRRSQSCR